MPTIGELENHKPANLEESIQKMDRFMESLLIEMCNGAVSDKGLLFMVETKDFFNEYHRIIAEMRSINKSGGATLVHSPGAQEC